MKMTIRFLEINGMPRMMCDLPVREKGDGLRLMEWANQRYLDFKDICDEHKAATLQVLEDKRKGIRKDYQHRFTDFFQKVFDKRFYEHEAEKGESR